MAVSRGLRVRRCCEPWVWGPEARSVVIRRTLGTKAAGRTGSVRSPVTTVAQSVVNDNADLGIEAVAGVTDGDGNWASGNGNSAQCQALVCG
jgi:hypothetical protein